MSRAETAVVWGGSESVGNVGEEVREVVGSHIMCAL